jgi:hypothetical protein
MATYQSMDCDDIGLDPDFDIFSYYKYCYDLNFAVNRKGENVLEHSRTGSRTPTSGADRVNSARGGENI